MTFFCQQPFETLNLSPGWQSNCCPNWHHPSRFVHGQLTDIAAIWNHPTLQEFRQALLDGDDKFCKMCPFKASPMRRQAPTERDKAIMDEAPITLCMLTDETCNLTCPSCRVAHRRTPTPVSVQQMVDQLPGVQLITLLLSGDPFASKHAMDFLTTGDHSLPHVIVWTNGLLIPKHWHRIKRKVTVVVMSIDAATQTTYEKVRRGGRWPDLLAALAYIQEVRERGEILQLQLNFVCQADNFREMPAFVDLGLEYKADLVQFAAIASWPHILPDEWARMNVGNPAHPEFSQLCETLQDERMRLPIVDSSALSPEALATVAGKRAGQDCFGFRQRP